MNIKLSSGKICPRCGCDSLEEWFPLPADIRFQTGAGLWDKHYHCVALCGMSFGVSKLKNGKIKIGYDGDNEEYLRKRFKF